MRLTRCLLGADSLVTGLLMAGLLAACSSPTPVPPGGVLFADDFSNPDSGWNRQADAEAIADYADGEYRLLLEAPDSTISVSPGRRFGDVIVDVDARTVAGPLNNDFGVQCRRRDDTTFYFHLISADGFYAIGKAIEGEISLLTGRDMQPSDAIRQGYELNHMQAKCIGRTLALIVNGEPLAEVTDGELTEGDVGLAVGSYQQAGVEVRFDNLVVTNPG